MAYIVFTLRIHFHHRTLGNRIKKCSLVLPQYHFKVSTDGPWASHNDLTTLLHYTWLYVHLPDLLLSSSLSSVSHHETKLTECWLAPCSEAADVWLVHRGSSLLHLMCTFLGSCVKWLSEVFLAPCDSAEAWPAAFTIATYSMIIVTLCACVCDETLLARQPVTQNTEAVYSTSSVILNQFSLLISSSEMCKHVASHMWPSALIRAFHKY